MKYWEFTEETKESFSGEKLRRIVCTKDFLYANEGDLGGWLGANAVLEDNAWIADEAQVFGDATVSDNAKVGDYAKVYDNAIVCDNAIVASNAEVYGNAIVCDDARVCDDAEVRDDAEVGGNSTVGGNSKVCDDAKISTNPFFYKKIEESEKKKTTNNNNIGHKEIDGKLPMYTVLFKQFPNAMSESFLTDTTTDCISKLDFLNEAVIKFFKGDIKRTLLNILKAISGEEKGLNTIYNFLNFPKSLQRVAQCSVLGHEKYKEHDEDWQNFSRVPDAYNHYLNAAVRHLLEGDKINEEDSTDAIKVNHLDQAAWNFMAAIEVKARVETVK